MDLKLCAIKRKRGCCMKYVTRDADLRELAMLTCCLHDLGKIRPDFQVKKSYNGG